MASDVFLKVTDCPGDSTVGGHEGEIELQSWSLTSTVPAGPRTSGGSAASGTSVHHDLNFTKSADESSNALVKANWTGTTIPEIILTVQRAGDKAGEKVDYLKLTFTDGLVTSVTTSGGPQEVPFENYSINYATVKREYFKTDKSGGGGGWMDVGWDVAKEQLL